MLQLRLPLRTITLTLARMRGPAPAPMPIRTPLTITNHFPINTSTHTPTPITTRTPTLRNILMSAPLPRAPTRPRLGIPPHLSLLAGSCHRLRRHNEPTSIKGLLHAAQSWKYQFRECFHLNQPVFIRICVEYVFLDNIPVHHYQDNTQTHSCFYV